MSAAFFGLLFQEGPFRVRIQRTLFAARLKALGVAKP